MLNTCVACLIGQFKPGLPRILPNGAGDEQREGVSITKGAAARLLDPLFGVAASSAPARCLFSLDDFAKQDVGDRSVW